MSDAQETKKEPEVTTIKKEPEVIKSSGGQTPSIQEIGTNVLGYDFRINEITIVPRVEIFKGNKLVRVIQDSALHKYGINLNPEYADKFLEDITNDIKVGIQEVVKRKTEESKENKENK